MQALGCDTSARLFAYRAVLCSTKPPPYGEPRLSSSRGQTSKFSVGDVPHAPCRASQRTLPGDIYLGLGRDAEAVIEYDAALQIDPEEKNWRNPRWRGRAPSAR